MTYIIKNAARVSAFINLEAVELDLKAGEHELEPAIAELLVAQGIAELITEQPKPKTSKSKASDIEENN